MKKFSSQAPVLTLLAVLASFPTFAVADDSLAKFKGGIGVIPVSSGVVDPATPAVPTAEVVNRNIVRGVPPAGQIWVIADLMADVQTDGQIHVDGMGLLLGGGNNIGTNAGARVFATLFCGNTPHNSDLTGVPLGPNGDFRIDDLLSPAPPATCASPVLLIRNTAPPNRVWFAAGILDTD